MSLAIQTIGVLLVCIRIVIVLMELTNTMIVVSSHFSQSISKGKTKVNPLFVVRSNAYSLLFDFMYNALYIFFYITICRNWTHVCCNHLIRRGNLPFLG